MWIRRACGPGLRAGPRLGLWAANQRVPAGATLALVALLAAVQQVVALAAEQLVAAVLALEDIAAVVAEQTVRPAASDDDVLARPAVDEVDAAVGADEIVASVGEDLVVAREGDDHVGMRRALKNVVAGSAHDGGRGTTRMALVMLGRLGRARLLVDHGRLGVEVVGRVRVVRAGQRGGVGCGPVLRGLDRDRHARRGARVDLAQVAGDRAAGLLTGPGRGRRRDIGHQ